MELSQDLREFIELLNYRRVDYLIVGAHALAWYGLPRYTKDVDVFVRVSPENAVALEQVIADFGFASTGLSKGDFLLKDQIIQLGMEPHRIDLLTGITGVNWDEAWESRCEGLLGKTPVNYLGKSAFVKNKLASGRLQDLADVERLREILGE